MANPQSLFDPCIVPLGIFDNENTIEGWFDREFAFFTTVASSDVFFVGLHTIEMGMVVCTAAGMGGVIQE